MPASSSSSSGQPLYAVWLYDTNFVRVALIDVPVPLPNLVTYLGLQYVWSKVHWAYLQSTAFIAGTDAGAPLLSVVADPQQ